MFYKVYHIALVLKYLCTFDDRYLLFSLPVAGAGECDTTRQRMVVAMTRCRTFLCDFRGHVDAPEEYLALAARTNK
jgi:hypothetical protein